MTWVLAASAFAAVLVCWPRLARCGLRAVLGRAATQATAMVLVLIAVAATLNSENGWYADWSDLRSSLVGADSQHGGPMTYGADPVQPALSPKAIVADSQAQHRFRRHRSHWEAGLRHRHRDHGEYTSVTLPGPTGRDVTMEVWLPAAYNDPAQRNRTFPVIEAFHGVPGTPDDFHRPVHLGAMISRLVERHQLAAAIVIAPTYLPHGVDTECVDAPGMPMLTWLTRDVPRWVVQHLRARPDRGSWTTLGFSAGGYCAALSAMHRPQQFGSMIVLGGYFRPIFGRWHPFGGRVPACYDLMRREKSNPPPVAAWVQVALQDPVSGRPSERFAQQARAPMSVTTVVWRRVGHRMSVWIQAMPLALQWLGATRAGFRPSATGE
ncbi:alpha/beta hydrolase [Flexivirga alba]|uniref:Alpha/beta hydrolase n=1 Tax=Flexivirga alba TaxID=702742 RepID=A0ABW2AAW4_9MICO